jgi:hypothetical protein
MFHLIPPRGHPIDLPNRNLSCLTVCVVSLESNIQIDVLDVAYARLPERTDRHYGIRHKGRSHQVEKHLSSAISPRSVI